MSNRDVKLILLAASIALMGMGCLAESPSAPAPASQNGSLRGEGNSDVPLGCHKEWSPADVDSVLNCPDIAPPGAPH